MPSADVVIIGAGVIGASIAWHLTQRGCTSVVLLERSVPGSGSTALATGGFRAQFATAVNIRLSLLSRAKLLRFEEETGGNSGYRPCGYLFVADDAAAEGVLRRAQTLQHALGLNEARMVGPAEVREINPAVGGDITGAAFCPTDGFIAPLGILRGYLHAAGQRGAVVNSGEEVVGFRSRGGSRRRIASVITRSGEISAGVVVNAAGPWAGRLGVMAGIPLPVEPLRRQVAVTEPTGVLPDTMPMTIFTEDGFHLRERDGRVLLLWPDVPRTQDPFDTSVDEGWVAEVTRRAERRIPGLRGVLVDRKACWSGLYEMTPDGHAIVGPSSEVENLYLANGSSGHGVMHAPALGQIVSEMILNGSSSVDVDALRPSRFAEGRPNEGAVLL